MRTLRCQIFGQKIRIKIDDAPPTDRYMINWIAAPNKNRATIFIHSEILRPENSDILMYGLQHDLFEIACWKRGVYDCETETFLGFDHAFFSACMTRVVNIGMRLFNRLTEMGAA